MMHKLNVLTRIAKRLNAEGVVWGIGASLLLYFKGIAEEFHDIDIMTTAEDVDRLKNVLCEMGELQPPNPNAKYLTKHFYEFMVDGVDVDVMEGFVIVKDGVAYDCPFTAASVCEYYILDGQKIPLQSVADWRRYYELMGRTAKVELIDRTALTSLNERRGEMKHKVRLTVIDKKLYPELQKQYCADPNSGACPCYNVGDVFEFYRDGDRDDFWHCGLNTLIHTEADPDIVAGGPRMPHCSELWDAISRYIYTGMQGGSIMKGWMERENEMIACCSDGTRPVIFKIERIDYE